MRKACVGVAIMAAAILGTTALTGTALAGGYGNGGSATNNCLNIGLNVLSGIGIIGSGSASGASCNASANG